MDELTVQKVYDILKERLSIIEHILSDDSSFKLTSKKLKKCAVFQRFRVIFALDCC